MNVNVVKNVSDADASYRPKALASSAGEDMGDDGDAIFDDRLLEPEELREGVYAVKIDGKLNWWMINFLVSWKVNHS